MEGVAKRVAREVIRDLPYGGKVLRAYDTVQSIMGGYGGPNYRKRKYGGGSYGWSRKLRRGIDRRNVGTYRRTQAMKRRTQRWCCAELHNLDGNPPAVTDVLTAGTSIADNLVQIAQGTGVSQRQGRKIFVKRIDIKVTVVNRGDVNADQWERVRVCLYQDKQCNGSAPAIGDLHAGGDKTLAFRNLDEIARFKIWKDKVITLSNKNITYNTTASAYQTQAQTRTFYWRLRNLNVPVHYNGTSGVLSEIADNTFGVIAYTSQRSTKTDVQIQYRIRFDA